MTEPLPLSECVREVAAELTALTRVDGCANCHNVEPARSWTRIDDGCRTGHHCTDCGLAWTTDWKD